MLIIREDISCNCLCVIKFAGRAIRHRACALKDTAHALIDTELDEEFEKQCQAILESRRNRGEYMACMPPLMRYTNRILRAFLLLLYVRDVH